MNDLLYLVIFMIGSIIVGIIFYKCLVNSTDEKKPLKFKLYQTWNHTICFFVGVGVILYYFIKVRWVQISNGAPISLTDIILALFLLMSAMGLLPYFLTNITKGIASILNKVLKSN